MTDFANHVNKHPFRLLVTMIVLALLSWFLAGWAIVLSLNASHSSNVEVCLSVNELRRELYVAASDLNIPAAVRDRFLPTDQCEGLP